MSKLRVDMAALTPRLLGEIGQVVWDDQQRTLADALQGPLSTRAMAAVAFVVGRRDNPELTFDDALDTPMTDYDIVNAESVPEVQGGSNGGGPLLSPVSGG